jgi:hypothetical protein
VKCIQDLEGGRVIEGTRTHEILRPRFAEYTKIHLEESVLGHVEWVH